MWSRISSIAIALSALIWIEAASAQPRPFSLYGLAGWEEETFFRRKHTEFNAVNEGRAQVIEADCKESASSYVWKQEINLTETPILTWRWKVENIFPGLNEREESGDDFPARIYVVNSGGFLFWRSRAIAYVWSNGEQGAESWPSGYTDRVHVVPVRAGTEGVGLWQEESRNIQEDFKKFFDVDTDTIAGVAIMSDCDDHKGSARAWFGDVEFVAP